MFILTTISDLVQIPPFEFYKRSRFAVEDKVNEKYSNKIVQKIGLCVCMYDLLKHSDGLIGHGTGFVNVNVEFRMIVFRPFKGEIIQGTISNASKEGIRISTEFFNDIYVPPHLLFPDTEFEESEQVYIWRNEGSELYFDKGDIVRFRIENEEWHDQSELAPPGKEDTTSEIERKVPYSIVASMQEPGLGNVLWW